MHRKQASVYDVAQLLPSAMGALVSIEIGVLRNQCLDRRLADPNRMIAEIAAWEQLRNAAGARVKWMFTTERARTKLARAYPEPTKES